MTVRQILNGAYYPLQSGNEGPVSSYIHQAAFAIVIIVVCESADIDLLHYLAR
jgi:hypothetical protein